MMVRLFSTAAMGARSIVEEGAWTLPSIVSF
jgi:hypothetical protein